ncbi:hypothetical protein FB107DRAFT_250929 [Schizophyllum commune]
MFPYARPPFLSIPLELQDAICREPSLRKKDLARLALTCRSWYIPANVVLWEYIIGLGPLLALMPEGTWNGMETTTPEGTLYDDPPLTIEHWTPVLRLSLLVKRLHLNDVTRTIQRRVMQYPPPTTLFPSLRSLTIDMRKASNELGPLNGLAAAHLIFLRAIIPQTLTKLILFDAPILFDILPLFSRLETLVTEETHAASLIPDDSSQHGKALTSIVQGISCCEHLSTVGLKLPFGRHAELMEALARLPALEHLHVWFRHTRRGQWRGRRPAYPDDAFPALTFLELKNVSYLDVAILLKSREKRGLRGIDVDSRDRETPESLAHLTARIKRYCDPVTLEIIRLRRSKSSVHWPISFALIAPLTAFRGLAHVSLSMFCGVQITEEEWELIGKSWPRLQSLSMRPRHNIQPACSLATLVTIAKHCPALQKLYLPFNTAVLPEIQALDAAEIRRTESGVATSSQDEVPSRSALSVTCAINTVDSVVVVGYTLYD